MPLWSSDDADLSAAADDRRLPLPGLPGVVGLTAMAPAEGFAAGETVVGGMHGEQLEHNFCAWCMSFTRVAGMDFVNVRPTLLDDPSWFRPYIETCTATKLPFAATGAVESFVEFPPMEEFGALMERYRAWAG